MPPIPPSRNRRRHGGTADRHRGFGRPTIELCRVRAVFSVDRANWEHRPLS
ncbi:hypothetical protein DF122_02150 [Burkholderia pseudomallei]|nr:hypothetical protein [Burkholderia pseudomallei]RIV62492.1 hypothetical protein D2W72_28340 [Burkholderia pseudomallei]RIV70032.1 hypothetical protein D2V84_25015 [Burkholderia pseudomallei]RPE24506.1 hypothetical protein DF127_04925 [Burkholderia pseudomallei]RPE26235.1 hypothetical protein DF068_02135 [Burkholderia pseudomallei]